MKAYLRLLYAINILIYKFDFFFIRENMNQSVLGTISLKENMGLVIETHKCRDKRNRKLCFCRHTEVENRKAKINNNNNNKKMPHPFGLKYMYI